MDNPTFRAVYTEFSNATTYSDAAVNYWLAEATNMLSATVWGTSLDMGIGLYTAHFLALGQRNAQAAAMGGVPGQATGAVSSKSVGGVSISYDTGATNEADAGQWNATTYGKKFFRYAQMFGAGPVVL